MRTPILLLALLALAAPAFAADVINNVEAGSEVQFIASSDGVPAPTFQWTRNGVAIPGATGTTYSILKFDATTAGDYTVIATNVAGSATSDKYSLVLVQSPSKPTIKATIKKPNVVIITPAPGTHVVVQNATR